MTTETITIVVLIILAGIAIGFRRWYIKLPRTYRVSEQLFGTIQLTTIEHNPRYETAIIELLIQSATPNHQIEGIGIEFISMKREITKYSLEDLGIEDIEISNSTDQKTISIKFEKRDLMRGIRNKEIKRKRFRFVVELKPQIFLKSHDFVFSTRYMLSRPDSGKYN